VKRRRGDRGDADRDGDGAGSAAALSVGMPGTGTNQSWAARNGFVCQPGTWFKGEDGRRHICQ
jgi:hypothetical protein